jgi:PAS domain S-box-containing protein
MAHGDRTGDSASTLSRLEAILRACPDAVVTIDARGTITEWAGAAERTFGWTREQVLGRELATVLVPPPLQKAHREGLARAVATGRGDLLGRPLEFRAMHANGNEIPVEITITRVALDGPPVFTAFVRDISERVAFRAERELAAAREHEARLQAEQDRAQLTQADRLKDEFLATVSHELRTPLQSILGWADLLASSPDDPATVAKAAGVIARNAAAQAKVVGDMLDISRVITGRLRLRSSSVDARKVVERSVAAARPMFEAKRMTIEIDAPKAVGEVFADAERLEQAIGNLLSNAAKFSAPGSSACVRVRHEGDEVVISVSDKGEGIAEDFLPFVFDHFRQGDARPTRRHGGLGLGLAIVRHIVELHGGTVEARSEGPGSGAELVIRLRASTEAPVHHAPSDRPAPTKQNGENHSLEGVRLLCVDDHADALELLDLALRRAGATVVTASSAAEAFEALETSSFDLVLTDIGMPGEDGLELMNRWRACPVAKTKPTPFAALTAFAGRSDKKKLLDAGFVAHFAKPMRADEIIEQIGRLVPRRD